MWLSMMVKSYHALNEESLASVPATRTRSEYGDTETANFPGLCSVQAAESGLLREARNKG